MRTVSLQQIRDKLLESVESKLTSVTQRANDPLYFEFYFKPDHPFSQRLDRWFKNHNVDYFVAEHGSWGSIEAAGVSFRDQPDLAMLFKLEFVNG